MKSRKGSFWSKLLLTYSIVALLPLLGIMAVLFHLKWKAANQEIQNTVDYTAQLLGVQMESIRNTMSFISLDLMSSEEFMTAAKGLYNDKSTSYENAKNYRTMHREISAYSYNSSSYGIVFFSDKGYFMTNESYNRQYNYAYRLPKGALDDYDWIQGKSLGVNYGKEILPFGFFPGMLPNTDKQKFFSLVRAVRDWGKS